MFSFFTSSRFSRAVEQTADQLQSAFGALADEEARRAVLRAETAPERAFCEAVVERLAERLGRAQPGS